ncbi:MAG: PotD/PotF family extracellular solute-binding protein [Ilumatobacteraceae bacterium]
MRSSRRQFLARTAQLGVLLGAGLPILQACGGDDDDAGGGEVKEPIKDGLEPEKGPLKIFNYADYVNPDVVAGFEDKYGVKVEITTFDTDTESIQKLASGAVKVDLQHSVSAASIYKLIDGGLIRQLNKSYIPNFVNVKSQFKDPFYDKGAAYSVPYTMYTTGIGYRADRVDKAEVEERGWDMIWSPQYKGEISILDDSRESLFLAMMHKGLFDPNTTDKAVIDQAGADLSELVGLVNIKVNIEGYKDIPEGSTTIAHTWNGDLIGGALSYLPEGTGPEVLGYWYPADNIGPLGNDCMCVLANAENPVLAHLYIDYLLDKTVSELNFTWNGYLPAIEGLDADYLIGQEYVPENLRNAVLTNEQIDKGLRYLALDPDDELVWEDAWSKFTAG